MRQDELREIHRTAVEKGFWGAIERHGSDPDVVAAVILSKIALIDSETSEVLEAYRKQKGSDLIMEEFADILIRVYDLIIAMEELGIVSHTNIEETVRSKMAVNRNRAQKHGNLI